MLERVKGGEAVVYGGLPVASFEKLMAEGALAAVENVAYDWRWAYAEQTKGSAEDFTAFAAWRKAALAAEAPPAGNSGGRDMLRELCAFNIAGSTPMHFLLP